MGKSTAFNCTTSRTEIARRSQTAIGTALGKEVDKIEGRLRHLQLAPDVSIIGL